MTRACAKINLGLNVVSRRPDGYHNIETVFLPVPLYDTISLERQTEDYPRPCQLVVTGNSIDCDEKWNLVVRAYELLAGTYPLPRVRIHLDKRIPYGAGLGGGSSDAAATVKLLNEAFSLEMTTAQMERCASQLGADCAFFIKSQAAYADGIGDRLYVIPGIRNQLCGLRMAVVKPDISIPTYEAYAGVRPHFPEANCLEVVMQPVETWRDRLVNDFEETIFAKYVELREIKNTLYRMGALYASMTGSGSAIYAFFGPGTPLTRISLRRIFPECYTNLVSIKAEQTV